MKTVKYQRDILNKDEKTTRKEEKERQIEVKKGYSSKTELRFPKEGNEKNGYPTTDLVVKLSEVTHPQFKRSGDDLIYTHQISLNDALQGVPTLFVSNAL